MPDSKTITNVISIFNRLQGIGTRSAKRIVIDLIKKKRTNFIPINRTIKYFIQRN